MIINPEFFEPSPIKHNAVRAEASCKDRRFSCQGRNHSHPRNTNTLRQFFFVITTTASTCGLVGNFQLVCYSY